MSADSTDEGLCTLSGIVVGKALKQVRIIAGVSYSVAAPVDAAALDPLGVKAFVPLRLSLDMAEVFSVTACL